jgi:hypothetical protein
VEQVVLLHEVVVLVNLNRPKEPVVQRKLVDEVLHSEEQASQEVMNGASQA